MLGNFKTEAMDDSMKDAVDDDVIIIVGIEM